MLRKSTLAMAIALGLAPAAGYGLGLGEVRSSSLMGQVFEGAIELTDVAADEVPNIKARLAPAEAFRKAGIDYSSAVRRLRFKPFVQPNGRPAIRVTSSETVREPYLNFLVEVEWSQGRTVREFTVLLDPPTYTERRAPQVQTPVAGPREASPTPVPSARAAPSAQPTAAAAPPPSLSPTPAAGPDYGPVKQGETLWRIADRNRAAGVSAEQTMIAILRANPDAFIGGNINRLKAGARLKLPTVQQYATLDPLDARDAYLRQMGRPVPQRPAARAPAPLPVAATEAPAGDRVRLVTPSPAAPVPAQEASPQAVAPDLRQDVLLAHEKAESARQTADQLQGRVSDLETQLRDMQRLLVLKDTQLAQLQQKAEEAIKAAAAAPLARATVDKSPAPAVEAPAEPVVAGAAVPAAKPAEPTAAATTPPAEPVVAAPAPEPRTAEPAPAPVAPAEPAAAPPVAVEPKPAPPAAPAVSEPRPEPRPAQPAGLASLLSDPANVLGAGIAGLGVLGALLWAIIGRRRGPATAEPARAEAAPAPEPAVGAVPAEPAPVLAAAAVPVPAAPVTAAATGAAVAAMPTEGDRVATEDLAALEVSTSDLFGLKGETTEVDPTEEADVYIAYGRYEQAEQLLRLALEMEPGRLALQHKLLEVYAASRDVPAFSALFAKLQAAGKAAEDPAAWQQAMRMGSQIDPTNPLYGGVGAAAAPALGDALGKARGELAADLDRVAGRGADFGELTFKSPVGDSSLDDIDTGSVLNDLSLDLGTEDTNSGKSSHPFNLDVTEELKGSGGAAGIGEIDASEALAWNLNKADATGLVEAEIKPVEVTAEQLDDAPRDIPDLGDLEIGPDTALEMGGETTLMHADTTLELVDDVETKLDLARAYIELGDQDSARLMLEEAMQEGNAAQQAAASALLKELA